MKRPFSRDETANKTRTTEKGSDAPNEDQKVGKTGQEAANETAPSGPGAPGTGDVSGTGLTSEADDRRAPHFARSAAAKEKELQQIDRQEAEGSITEDDARARREALEGGGRVLRAGPLSEQGGGVRITNRSGEEVRVQIQPKDGKVQTLMLSADDMTVVEVTADQKVTLEVIS